VVTLQTALVRSDYWHVEIATFAMMIFAGTILLSFQSRRTTSAAVLLVIAYSMLTSRPPLRRPPLRPSSYIRMVQQVLPQLLTQCPAGFREFDRGCFSPEFTTVLQSATSYLDQHSGPQEHIVVFPYQTIFGIASKRSVAGGLMQAYTASGPSLSQLEIAGLGSASAPAGLYLTDSDSRSRPLSRMIDGTYNFTRTPEIWFWMLRHYRVEGRALSAGVFGLLRDDSRATRISLQPQAIGWAAQTFPIRERSSVVDLGAPDWPRGADFLRLRLTVRYGFWWRLRKPDRMQLEITRIDGSSELRSFIAQPNVSTDIWVYPWSAPELANYLDADESNWRTTPRPAITHLRIVVTPLDWVSVTPTAIVLEAAEALRIDMRP
jgi:hypothetical protein